MGSAVPQIIPIWTALQAAENSALYQGTTLSRAVTA
jgi:hypothetical protein